MLAGIAATVESMDLPIRSKIHIDNQAALSVCLDSSSWRTRHLAIRASTLRDLIRFGYLSIEWVPSDRQRADGLTKFLGWLKQEVALKQWTLFPVEPAVSEMELMKLDANAGSHCKLLRIL